MQNSALIALATRLYRFAFLPLVAVGLVAPLAAQSTIIVTLDPRSARLEPIPEDFLGMSLEMNTIEDAYNGTPWLTGAGGPYATMLKRIGVKNIRIGGNSSERTPYATDRDAADVNDFCQLIGANLIWNLPVEANYNLTNSTAFAKTMMEHKARRGYTFSTTFEIGNEPDINGVDQPTWQTRFDAFNQSLRQQINWRVTTTGPSAAGSQSYANDLSKDPTYAGFLHRSVGFVTQHWYPFGGANSYGSVNDAIDAMLTSSSNAKYQKFFNGWAETATNNGFRPRMEETNSMYNGGFPGASNSFAAALWTLDYYSYFAQNTMLAGINLHTGQKSSVYNPISPTGSAPSYTLNGAGYGMFAFSYNGHGRPVPVTLSNPDNVNVTVYATLERDGTENVHVVNKTHTSTSNDVTVNVTPGHGYRRAQIMYLKQDNNDPTQSTGITLGGQPVNGDGTWSGGYTSTITPNNGVFSISVPRTQAAIVRFY